MENVRKDEEWKRHEVERAAKMEMLKSRQKNEGVENKIGVDCAYLEAE